jgi:hypothetical protein
MKLINILSIIGMFSLFSCKKHEPVTIEHAVSEFDTLVLSDVFDITLIQGTENSIKITGANQFIEDITWENKDNTLTFQNNAKHKWLNPKTNKIKLEITVNGLSKIVANETCTITSKNTLIADEMGLILKSKLNHAALAISCNTFYYWNNFPCGGTVGLQGTCNTLKVWNYALMQINASELQTSTALIENYSKGDVRVWCTDTISYKINGSGGIRAKGSPSTQLNLGGTGNGLFTLE